MAYTLNFNGTAYKKLMFNGVEMKEANHNGVLRWKSEQEITSPSDIRMNSGEPGVTGWSGYTYSPYFDLTSYDKLTGTLKSFTHSDYTSGYFFRSATYLYLVSKSGTYTEIASVGSERNYAGDDERYKDVNYDVSKLSGEYRVAMRISNFRENTYESPTGYSKGSVSNLMLK